MRGLAIEYTTTKGDKMRLLIPILIVIFLIWLLFIRKSGGAKKDSDREPKNGSGEVMVECECCKTYSSKRDSIFSNGRYFCSKECLKKG